MSKPGRVTLDFETRSACELKKAGAFKYSLDPTTRPTCLAFKERGPFATTLLKFDEINKPWKELPPGIRCLWTRYVNEGHLFVAHNAFFETVIYKNILVARYGWPDIPFKRFRCTAAKAAACALPRSLEGAGEAMRLNVQKDKRGYAAMVATCKPTKQWNAWTKARAEVKAGARVGAKKQQLARSPEPPRFLEPKADPAVWNTLYEYCVIDVKAEEALDRALPDLTPIEQEIWFLNQRVNWRGLNIDIPLVQKIVAIMNDESKTALKELDTLTMGLVTKPGARQSILDFLKLEGIELPDIRAKTVEDILKKGGLSDDMTRLLEIRQALSKTSTKKYQSFLDRANSDGRVCDILLYCGASTGRDAGTGINPQNFPKGLLKVDPARPYANVENVARCDTAILKILYGDSLAVVFSSILRNMIIPTDGCELFVADFSKIEVAVLWWLADNEAGLDVLNSGKDPYKYQAAANTGKHYDEINDDERQLGKAQILGCIAAGSLVSVPSGAKPIEQVTEDDRLWDGLNWVKHGGVLRKGQKGVISLPSLKLKSTPDHWFLQNGTWRTAVEIVSSAVTQPHQSERSTDTLSLLQRNLNEGPSAVSVCAAYAELKKRFESIVFGSVEIYTALNVLKRYAQASGGEKEIGISWLIQNLGPVGELVSIILEKDANEIRIKTFRGTAVAVFAAPSTPLENFWNTLLHCAGLTNGDSRWTELITTGTMSPETYELLAKVLITETAETYDILDAGPDNCFQVDGLIAHNCGFRMGWKRFKETAYDMYRVKLTNKQSVKAIKDYREANRPVVDLWGAYENAAVEAVENPGEGVTAGKCRFIVEDGFLTVKLPSGRKLYYREPSIIWRSVTFTALEEDAKGREIEVEKTGAPKKTIQYMGLGLDKKSLRVEYMHGGIWAENITQATARELMKQGELRLEAEGYRVLLAVHDESLSERKIGEGSVDEFIKILCARPKWADDKLPIDAKGWVGKRYRK